MLVALDELAECVPGALRYGGGGGGGRSLKG